MKQGSPPHVEALLRHGIGMSNNHFYLIVLAMILTQNLALIPIFACTDSLTQKLKLMGRGGQFTYSTTRTVLKE